MSIQHLPAPSSAEDVTAALTRDGAVVVDSLVSAEFIDLLAAELQPFMDATPPGRDGFSGRRTRRTGSLIARSPLSRELVMNPLVLAATKQLLAGGTTFQLHLTQVIAIGPGEPAQMIHRDQWAYDFFTFPKGYEVQNNTIWAMTDFTIENGGTRVVVGSNHLDDGLKFKEEDSEGTEMKKGSVLFYTGSVYHGGGANHSDQFRVGINITYNRAWLRQEENQYLATPLEIAKTLPADLLRLMGYARGAYALGYVGDSLDPIAIVRPDLADNHFGDPAAAQQIREQS
ncbi:MAG TPA: phytanoyl-CoA dioxygenase family protein, partial [Candidatus Binataceae bacterium]|nr:phytanoyl-CoA dioxygenase family protein [Candidatus Binataceae bacterium]